MDAEFQRIARRDKKAFLSNQCKETEENHRIGKTRDLFKKIRDTKGTFHAKMGTIKDRNDMDLIEQKILRKGGKITQKSYTKIRPGADCSSDHELLIAKFRRKLKKVRKTTRPFRYDLNQIPYNYTMEVTKRFKGLDLIDRVPEDYGRRFITLYKRQ